MVKKRTMRIFRRGWRENLQKKAGKVKIFGRLQPGTVNPFSLRRGQVPLEFFKRSRNAQERRRYIKKYGKFLPQEKLEHLKSINPLDNIENELLLSDYVDYPDWAYGPEDALEGLKKFESDIEENLHLIKRPNEHKYMEELLQRARGEIYNREREIERVKGIKIEVFSKKPTSELEKKLVESETKLKQLEEDGGIYDRHFAVFAEEDINIIKDILAKRKKR